MRVYGSSNASLREFKCELTGVQMQAYGSSNVSLRDFKCEFTGVQIQMVVNLCVLPSYR